MVNLGDATLVMVPRTSSSSPLSSVSLPSLPAATVAVVTVKVGVMVAVVPLMAMDDARFMSKFKTVAPGPMVTDGLKGTFTVDDASVAVSLVTALVVGSTTTTSGLDTESVAPLYVPDGGLTRDSGSKVARLCVSSISVGFANTLGLVPPFNVMAETVISKAMTCGSAASPKLMVVLLAPAVVVALVELPQPVVTSMAQMATKTMAPNRAVVHGRLG